MLNKIILKLESIERKFIQVLSDKISNGFDVFFDVLWKIELFLKKIKIIVLFFVLLKNIFLFFWRIFVFCIELKIYFDKKKIEFDYWLALWLEIIAYYFYSYILPLPIVIFEYFYYINIRRVCYFFISKKNIFLTRNSYIFNKKNLIIFLKNVADVYVNNRFVLFFYNFIANNFFIKPSISKKYNTLYFYEKYFIVFSFFFNSFKEFKFFYIKFKRNYEESPLLFPAHFILTLKLAAALYFMLFEDYELVMYTWQSQAVYKYYRIDLPNDYWLYEFFVKHHYYRY